jgi:hypothetical protein
VRAGNQRPPPSGEDLLGRPKTLRSSCRKHARHAPMCGEQLEVQMVTEEVVDTARTPDPDAVCLYCTRPRVQGQTRCPACRVPYGETGEYVARPKKNEWVGSMIVAFLATLGVLLVLLMVVMYLIFRALFQEG